VSPCGAGFMPASGAEAFAKVAHPPVSAGINPALQKSQLGTTTSRGEIPHKAARMPPCRAGFMPASGAEAFAKVAHPPHAGRD
jgi:hypothetical protein